MHRVGATFCTKKHINRKVIEDALEKKTSYQEESSIHTHNSWRVYLIRSARAFEIPCHSSVCVSP
jgi:hypothetical protein